MEEKIKKSIRVGYANLTIVVVVTTGVFVYIISKVENAAWAWPLAIGYAFAMAIQFRETLKRITLGRSILSSPDRFTAEEKEAYIEISNRRTEADLVGGNRRTLWTFIVILALMLLYFSFVYFEGI